MFNLSKMLVGRLLLCSAMAASAITATAAIDNKAYGILAFSNDQYRLANNVVTFDLVSDSEPVFTTAVAFAETSTAGAYANGAYYVATTVSNGSAEVPSTLVKVDLKTGAKTTVGAMVGYEYVISDMTFDHSTATMYALSRTDVSTSSLHIINLNDGSSTKIADLDRRLFTLAASYDGQLYGISLYGDFCAIDKKTGAITVIGNTGHYPQYVQSMEFDHATRTLWWVASTRKFNESGTIEVPESFVATIDVTTGAVTRHQEFGDNQLAGLYIPSFAAPDNCPAPVTLLSATAANGGASQATISWVNPSTTFGGETLKAISKVEIQRDGKLVGTITNAEPGKTSTFVDNIGATAGAFYTWTVTAYNSNGAGAALETEAFVGRDVPAAVASVSIDKLGPNSARIHWPAVTIGANGGWTDTEGLTYTVVRTPDNTTVADGLTETQWMEPGVEVSNTYNYIVTAKNSCGVSEPTVSPNVALGPKLGVPYTCGFDSDFGQWTPVDANQDGNTWERSALSWAKADGAFFQSANYPGDDWLISNIIEFEPNSTYKVSISCLGGQHPLTFYLLNDSDIASPLQEIGTLTPINGWELNTLDFQFTTGSEIGDCNVGIHNGAPKGNSYAIIDRIDIEKLADNNLAATSLLGNIRPIIGNTYGYAITVANKGGHAYSNFTVELVGNDGNVLASKEINETIEPAESKTFTVDFTIPDGCTLTALYGRVNAPGDEIEADNTTAAMPVSIQPLGSPEELPIGSQESTGTYHPMNLGYKYSATLNIYSAEELSVKSGRITGIKLGYSSSYSTAKNINIRFFMANTDRVNNADGWIPQEEMTEVFNGYFDVEDGGYHDLEFTFDRAFDYDGSNLALMTVTSFAESNRSYVSGVYQPYYTSPLSGNNVIVYANDNTPFSTDTKPTSRTGNSVITLMMQSGGASISGIVSDSEGNPVEGATVKIAEIRAETLSQADGSYRFDFVPNDTYTVSVSMFGYDAQEPVSITVDDENVTADLTLTKLPTYGVSARVVAPDGTPLENAAVSLSGYTTLTTATDANGNFSFADVVTAAENTLTIACPWYVDSTSQFALDADKNFGDISLDYARFAPAGAEATVDDNGSMTISWNDPTGISTVRYDSGVKATQIGFTDASVGTIVIGTAFRTPMTLKNVSWLTSSEGGPHNYVSVFVYDLDENGDPTGTILCSRENVKNTDNQWTTLDLGEAVEAPRGCFIAINYPGFLGLGVDNAPQSHPLQPNTYAFSTDFASGDFMYFGPETLSGNLMLRAGATLYSAEGQPSVSGVELPDFYRYSVTRTLGYGATEGTVLTAETIDSTELADAEWAGLPAGVYRYAVTTVFPDGTKSEPSFTDYVAHDMIGSISLKMQTNSHSGNPDGAKVTLTALSDGNELTAEVDESGAVEFAEVWRDDYALNITLPGYEFNETVVSMAENKNVELKDLVLKEIIATPVNVGIDGDIDEGFRLTWNESGEIFEDFEDHAPFTAESPGEIGWQYIDVDGARTFAEPDFNFPGRTQPCSFMVFNPWMTTPVMATQRSVSIPFSGKSELACFAGYTGSDDWFISPRLTYHNDFTFSFYARGYSQTYGEVIRVGYSTTTPLPYSFEWVSEEIDVVKQQWTKYEFTIPANARYVAVNSISPDGFMLFIDDVTISSGNDLPMNTAVTGPEVKYAVMLDGELIAETTDCEFTIAAVTPGEHTAAVKAVYASGESAAAEVTFGDSGLKDLTAPAGDITVSPNPARDYTVINGEFNAARLIDMSGRCVATFDGDNQRLNLSGVASGFYVLSIEAASGNVVNVKLTVR